MRFLTYRECLNLDKPTRLYYVNAGDTNPSTGKAYAINPASGVWDDNYFDRTYGAQNRAEAAQRIASDPIAQAKKIRDFNIESNQPAIQSYEASKAPLQQRYQNLLNTIKGNQQVAENRQTTTTNNELGRRGISSDSGVYQQEMTNALNPITTSFTNQQGEALANQNVDLSAIDRAIAQLKAGDPSSAVSAALNIGSQEQQASQFQQQLAQQKAISDATLAFQKEQANKKTEPDRYLTIGAGGLYDTQTGKVIQGIDAIKAAAGGSGW